MQKAINRLHRHLLADVNHGNGTLGALVIAGTASSPNDGKVTSFSGGNPAPIVMGLVKEMRRDPSMLEAVRIAIAIVNNEQSQKSKA